MFGCINVNHNPIEFIKKVLICGNVSKKISVRHIISSIIGVNMIEQNVGNSDERVIK